MDRQDEHSDGRHRKAEEAVGAAAPATPHLTPQALAVQLICHCEEVADEGVEVLVLRGLLRHKSAAVAAMLLFTRYITFQSISGTLSISKPP